MNGSAWQRCYVHFLRNAVDYLPRKSRQRLLAGVALLYDRRNGGEAQRDLAAWVSRWQKKYPKLTDWVEENIGSTLTLYRSLRQQHKHLEERQHARTLARGIAPADRGRADLSDCHNID